MPPCPNVQAWPEASLAPAEERGEQVALCPAYQVSLPASLGPGDGSVCVGRMTSIPSPAQPRDKQLYGVDHST